MCMVAFYFCIACTSLQMKASITVQVWRRISFDVYVLNSSEKHERCDKTNMTYLVNEGRCVTDQELLNGIYSLLIIFRFLNQSLQNAVLQLLQLNLQLISQL